MNENRYQKIASVNGALQAVHLLSVLEQAGIPCRSRAARGARYLDVLVPRDRARHARGLVAPAMFCTPA